MCTISYLVLAKELSGFGQNELMDLKFKIKDSDFEVCDKIKKTIINKVAGTTYKVLFDVDKFRYDYCCRNVIIQILRKSFREQLRKFQ